MRLREAAASEGIEVPDPNIKYGEEDRLADLLLHAGFSDVLLRRSTYTEERGDAELTWAATIDYGLAPALAEASTAARARVRERFLQATAAAPQSSFTSLVAHATRPR